jgi:predicted MFS family arabinose efflux permease
MGWVMLFWVVVIVAVPTVLWFLIPTPPMPSRKTDESSNIIPMTRLSRSETNRGESHERVGISAGRKGGGP